MNVLFKHITPVLSCLTVIILLTRCLNYSPGESGGSTKRVSVKKQSHKPGSSFNDTLAIEGPAAVFFEPDSLQLEKIRKVTDAPVFKSSMHEYRYQIRNAKMFLEKYWPHVKIVQIKNTRYLEFNSRDTTRVIDLDSQDPCGMFLFDGKRLPQLIDMMNIDTQVPDYFQSHS